MASYTDTQYAQIVEILGKALNISDLVEQTTLTTDGFFVAINQGTNNAKKIKIPLLRGFNGDWDASTNTPTLANGIGLAATCYRVSVGGTRDLGNGSISYLEDEIIYYNGEKWIKFVSETTANDLQGEIDALKDVIRVAPNYISPTSSITNVTQTIEKGSSLTDLDVNISFTQNDAGAVTGYSLEKDDVEISTTQNNTVTLSNITSSIVFKGIVSYSDGAIKNDNLGEPNDEGQILSGDVESGTRTITPRLKLFFGSVSAIPTTSASVRSLSGNQYETSKTINLATGTTNKIFVCAIPSAYSITSVIDEGNLGVDITSQYVLDDTIDVEDAGGNNNSYKIYAMTNSVPYGSNTNHKITIA